MTKPLHIALDGDIAFEQPTGRFDSITGLWVSTTLWYCPLSFGHLLIEPGFESDGASIPRFLWPLVGPRFAASTFPAALAHDALYAAELCTRKTADLEFLALLKSCGVGLFRGSSYYLSVRWFGGRVYRRHTEASITDARKYCRVVIPQRKSK